MKNCNICLIFILAVLVFSCKTKSKFITYDGDISSKELSSIYSYMVSDFMFTDLFDGYAPLFLDQTDKKDKVIYIILDFPHFPYSLSEMDVDGNTLRPKKELIPFDSKLLDQLRFPYNIKVVNYVSDEDSKKIAYESDALMVVRFSGLYTDENMFYICGIFTKTYEQKADYHITYVMGLKRCHPNSGLFLEKYEVSNSQTWWRKNHESDLDCDSNEVINFDPKGREK